MPVNALDIFALSQRLCEGVDISEAQIRCVISRAYYSAFHATKEVFPEKLPYKKHEGSHEEVIRRASTYAHTCQNGRNSAAELAKILPKLKTLRKDADYKFDILLTMRQAEEMLVRVGRVFELCEIIATDRRASTA